MAEAYTPSFEIKTYATIGVVCLQWSLLEQMILRIIACAENAPMDKVYITFGGLDLQPRINAALKLTRYAGWPQHLVKRIEAIRTTIQGKSGRHGLAERRNQVVHGVHKQSEVPGCVSLTMVRWDGPKRTQDVSLESIQSLAEHLAALAQEAWSIADDYGAWKFGSKREEGNDEQFATAQPNTRVEITQNFQNVIKRLFGKG